jgi:hypothetical protein
VPERAWKFESSRPHHPCCTRQIVIARAGGTRPSMVRRVPVV